MRKYDAVLFDLLTALLDSWALWNSVAGGEALGLRWRRAYLQLTYAAGAYRSYETLVAEAATLVGLHEAVAGELIDRWGELAPWPEAPAVLRGLRDAGVRTAVVTNCSEDLGRRAAALVSESFDVVVTAERAGFYKPDPHPYLLALREIGAPPGRTLFVAGSPADIPGAMGVGMSVLWHNRMGTPFVGSPLAPQAAYSTLNPVLAEVLGQRLSS